MAPSLARQRNSSTVSLRSCSEATSTSPLKTPCWTEEENVVRSSAASVQSVTSIRSGRSQQRRSAARKTSSALSVASHRTSRSSSASNKRTREDSYSPTSKRNQTMWNNADKRVILYARVAILIFIVLNLTKPPHRTNHYRSEATTLSTIYTPEILPTIPQGSRTKPRFLFGIFSTLREHDSVRRNVIRRTYLASDPNRICSIQELPRKPRCQIVYTFVVGANATGVTDMVDQQPSNLTVDVREGHVVNEGSPVVSYEEDVTYLNLQENMEYGKSPSWFLYANSIVNELGADFIAKVDSDTLVFPNRFLDEFASLLPTKERPSNDTGFSMATRAELRVYGGIPNDSIGCGGLRRPHCAKMGGKTYMQGQLHFLSVDLSRYVTSIPRDLRHELFVPIEDLCTAKYVHSHPKPVLEAVVSPQQNLWEHGKHIKDPSSYERRWNQVISDEQNTNKQAIRGSTSPVAQKIGGNAA